MNKVTYDHIQILGKENAPKQTSNILFTQNKAYYALRFHRSLPAYKETELKSLSSAAGKYGVRAIYVKDESSRFNLKAFKGLGGSYGVFRCLCERLGMDYKTATFGDFQKPKIRDLCRNIEFVTATDGNHGKGVAWAAGMFGCSSHIFMPHGTVEARRQAIEKAGAKTAVITDLNYDETVAYAGWLADKNGWIFIQDTAWEGYETVPGWIIEGYLTLEEEVCRQMGKDVPTHVFLQAGVGAMAGGVTGYLMNRYKADPPMITIAEPDAAACIYRSAEAGDGNLHSIKGNPSTIMAGLNCGTPCSITWPLLRDTASFYCACDDCIAEYGMWAYANPEGSDPVIISGESGAVTYGLLLRILQEKALKKLWRIDANSVILLINTEGDTGETGDGSLSPFFTSGSN